MPLMCAPSRRTTDHHPWPPLLTNPRIVNSGKNSIPFLDDDDDYDGGGGDSDVDEAFACTTSLVGGRSRKRRTRTIDPKLRIRQKGAPEWVQSGGSGGGGGAS